MELLAKVPKTSLDFQIHICLVTTGLNSIKVIFDSFQLVEARSRNTKVSDNLRCIEIPTDRKCPKVTSPMTFLDFQNYPKRLA